MSSGVCFIIESSLNTFISVKNEDVTGWGCYDEKTFIIREKAREKLGIDV